MTPIIDADAANRSRIQSQYPTIKFIDDVPQCRVYDADQKQHRISLRRMK